MFKTKNATCYHIFEHRIMLSVGVSKEETQHNITFFKMRECCQQVFKRKNAARCPPINATGSIFGAFVLSLGCHFKPKGWAEEALDVHLGLSVSRVAPQWPPDRFLDHFGSHFGTTLETQIEEQ